MKVLSLTYEDFINSIIQERGQYGICSNEYYERHHIVPRCMGGEGDYKCGTFAKQSKHPNCIYLYPREHYMAHKLLAEENPKNKKLIMAFWRMACNDNQWMTEDEYAELREAYAKIMSKRTITPETRKKISESNRGRKYSIDSRRRMSESAKNRPPMSESTRKKMSEKGKRENLSEVTLKKMSNAQKKRWTKEERLKMSKKMSGGNNPSARGVYCLELDMEFECAKVAGQYVGLKDGHSIIACCNQRRKTAGKSPYNFKRLHWCYIGDKDRIQELLMESNNGSPKAVKNIESGIIFESLTSASKWCGLSNQGKSIGECCKGKRKFSGRHPETGEKLTWEWVI